MLGQVIAVLGIALAAALTLPPPNAGFDYQIGGAYPPPEGVSVVTRDWFVDRAARGAAYSICYVNAFQTQPDEAGVERPDERSNWPRGLVLEELGDDPEWRGEYLIDISTARKRGRAARRVDGMLRECRRKGYGAVEFDNLDSWRRFDGTPRARRVPFGMREALLYARLLARRAHARGLAVAQKNTPEVTARQARRAGFDFAVAEECARYRECRAYTRVYGDRVIVIEYRRRDFRRACRTVGDSLSVVLRDRDLATPRSRRYRYDSC